MSVLPRRSLSTSHPKYFLPCPNPTETFSLFKHMDVKAQHIVLKALYAQNPTAPKKVVVKLYAAYEMDLGENEYALAQTLQPIGGFMPFICKITCHDHRTLKNKRLCKPNSKNDPLVTILVSKYINPIPWNTLGIEALRSCILQVFATCIHAFESVGFLHQDLHAHNVLIRRTRKTHIRVGDKHIETHGVGIYITDFELSVITEKTPSTMEQLVWDLNGFVGDLRKANGANLHHARGLENILQVLTPFMHSPQALPPWVEIERAIMSVSM